MTTKSDALAAALGIAVFERTPEGRFVLDGPAPLWLVELGFSASDEIAERFPFLEVFIPDAEEHWETGQPGPLYSDVWTEAGNGGAHLHLRAVAVQVSGRDVLCIEAPQSLYGETQAVVQHAHDATLAYERIAKLSSALAEANRELEVRNEEVQRATQAKSEFLARMSHEIRTPLNAILGMAELLWESPLAPEQREYVRIFRRAGENLLNLLNDILDLSKVEAGHLELERVEFDLSEVLEKASEIIAVRAHAKGLELSCRIAPDVPLRLMGDPDRLRQVIINLLGNAVKFTDRGEVGIRVTRAGEALRFEVFDTGIGIPSDKLTAVFESFTQADTSTSRKYGGTGLGLAISKKFVEMMGGRIWVESVPGAGSTFLFTPRFEALPAPRPPAEFSGIRCLVADDNASHRAAVRDLLAAWGAEVVEAANGRDAVTLAEASGFDVALLDARMPEMDGFEAASRLRGHGRVLLMLTTERPADAVRCRELGVRAVLKPLRRSELLECMRMPDGAGDSQLPDRRDDSGELNGFRILLADDSEDNRFLIRSYLKSTGCVLEECSDGAAVLKRFQEGSYSLVLVDVQMPVMDGYTATRAMRAWEQERSAAPTPILALTAHALKQEVQKSLDAGCDAHLTKPIQKATLLDAIRQFAVRRTNGSAPVAPAASSPVLVVVDSALEDLIPGYLQNRRNDVDTILKALERADYPAIRVLGHNMKGSGGGYGFATLTELGSALEKAALASDPDAVRRHTDDLAGYLGRLEIRYE